MFIGVFGKHLMNIIKPSGNKTQLKKQDHLE